VLRITCEPSSSTTVTLKLEGRLMGPWTGELDRVVRDSLVDSRRLCLDVSDLVFVDGTGADLLRALRDRGATLSGGSPYVTALLKGDQGG
jgi:anti-anti-sigma regulatory factor